MKKKLTKLEKIKRHLLSGKSITPLQALKLYGSFRLSAVIHTLKNDHNITIETKSVTNKETGSRYASYKLVK